jgi:hypothetical protein
MGQLSMVAAYTVSSSSGGGGGGGGGTGDPIAEAAFE